MKRHTALVVLAGLISLAGTATADETTFCNFFITTLPVNITTQGHWCFNRNLSTAITVGPAILINSDFVVVDLNNFKLGGGSAGIGTNAIGVYATNRRNITVRNGNIRGFKYGIRLVGTNAGNLLIENNVVDGNTFYGIETDGDSSVVRNNTVTNTGGTTTDTNGYWTYGIYANYDTTNSESAISFARDNTVINVFPYDAGTNAAVGIGAAVADHNVVSLPTLAYGRGVWANVCRDNTVQGGWSGFEMSCNAESGTLIP